MNPDRVFTLTEIVKIFKVKRHFVIHLVEKRLIEPLQDAKGRGKVRLYSYRNMIQIGLFIHLNRLELSYEMIKRILSGIHMIGEFDATKLWKYSSILGVVGKDDWFFANTVDMSGGTQAMTLEKFLVFATSSFAKHGFKEEDIAYYFILDVGNIIAHIDSRIATL